MKNVDAFVDLCKQIISDHATGALDLHIAAEKIHTQANTYPLERGAHPMLSKVSDLSFDIAEDYRTDNSDKKDWDIIAKTVRNYVEGNWESTCWMLSAVYGEYSAEKLISSCSVTARRQNGETIIDTAPVNLRTEFNRIIKAVNSAQTDERYLQNLAKLAPVDIGDYKLASLEVTEYLVEPYYSTA